MSKAEERAMEAYPKQDMYFEMIDGSNRLKREVFIQGYEAAQKELGWISVKDDLPKETKTYLTFSQERGLCLTDWIDGEWRDEFYDKVPVDLWMVIQEFPKKK